VAESDYVTNRAFEKHLDDTYAHSATRNQPAILEYRRVTEGRLEAIEEFQNRLLGGLILLSMLVSGGFAVVIWQRFVH
jgi:hypothetical protein